MHLCAAARRLQCQGHLGPGGKRSRTSKLDAIPADEREKVEKQVFRRDLESIWADTVKFFQERDPEQIERANQNPKRKMALIFRWYLGLSSK